VRGRRLLSWAFIGVVGRLGLVRRGRWGASGLVRRYVLSSLVRCVRVRS